ncbi:hypothetical protein LBMAG42_18180 [Deltaproteobacteria bacterium]|nr:hypothetical protein LBMAG42_18180 [Deltaproteobacteria bacterium]
MTPTPTTEPVHIDGTLDEAAWSQAEIVAGYGELFPAPGAPDPGVQARFLQDATALYIAVVVRVDHALNAPLVPRDQTLFNDWVGVSLDTFADGQRAFSFRVSARGVQADGIYTEGGDFWMQDLSWDTVWSSAATLQEGGYTVELAIPWRSLRYPKAQDQAWKVILSRFQPSPFRVTTAPIISTDQAATLTQGLELRPTPPPARGVTFEALPTLTGGYDIARNEATFDPGVSARLALSSSFTADLTANPDYSQIEADADQVTSNVKYPLFLREKRSFFLENADLFRTDIDVAYSRSIVEPLAGWKLSGRAGNLGLGFLGALDEHPAPSTIGFDYATGESLPGWDEHTMEDQWAFDHLVRARWDTGNGGSVGAILSDKELVPKALGNRLGGVDAVIPLSQRWKAHAQALYSETDLEGAAPIHGPAWQVGVSESSERVSFEVNHFGVGEGFRAENGYLEEVGRIGGESQVKLHFRDLGLVRSVEPDVHTSATFDLDAVPTELRVGPGVSAFVGQVYTEAQVDVVRERFVGQTFDRWSVDGFSAFPPTPSSNVYVAWDIGPVPHYAAETAEDLYLGFGYDVTGGAELAAGRFRGTVDVTFDQFQRSASGEVVYTTVLSRAQVGLNLTRPLSVRVISEWNTWDETLDSSVLLAFVENYGTAAWLGYQESYDLEGDAWTERSVFAKVSYLWRP